jgi:hypothetical protein
MAFVNSIFPYLKWHYDLKELKYLKIQENHSAFKDQAIITLASFKYLKVNAALMNSLDKTFDEGHFVSGNVIYVGDTAVNGVQL